MGGSAWASTTKTVTLYPTGDTDPIKAAAWKCQFTPTEGDGYISFSHSGNGQREAYLQFYNTGSDIYADYDTYTVSFDYYTYRGWHHNNGSSTPQVAFYAEGASVGNGTSTFTGRNTTTKNYLMLWSNSVSGNDQRTMYVNGSNTESFTSPQAGWARATITVTKSTGNVTYSVTSLDGNTAYLAEGNYTATGDGTSANCQGIYFSFGRLGGTEVRVNNVKVTTVIEVDEVTDPSASVSSVNTTSGERTLAVTDGVSDNDGSVTTYWSASTELTESNYSSVGTAVVSNTITTTSDVVYLISISTKGGISNSVTYNVADNVRLKAPSVALKSVTHNDGSLESPIFTIKATANTDVIGTPTSTLYYTFTPNGGSESARTAISDGGTYSPTAYGTLKVYATATGYAENVYSIPVSDYYYSDYSTDYTAYTENPFGSSSETTSGVWWTGATAYKSTASSNTTLGRLRFGSNDVTHLVIGYGVGRPGKNCSIKIRNNKLGNIQTLTIKNNNSSGVTSGTFYHDDLGTSGSGKDTDLTSEYYVPSYNTVAKHNCYVPVENPVSAAINDCKVYDSSSAFATAIESETFASAEEVYAFNTTYHIINGVLTDGIRDITGVIRNAAVNDEAATDWAGASTFYRADDQYTGAPDHYVLDKYNGLMWATQTIYSLPAGQYIVKANTRGGTDSYSHVYVNNGTNDLTTLVTDALGDGASAGTLGNGWSTKEGSFSLTEPTNIILGFYADGRNNKWASCDDWHLYRVESVSATIGANGYSTFASTYPLDMTESTQTANGFKAYSAKVEGTSVKFTQIDKWVNAGTGVLIEGTKGGSVTIPVTYNGNDISSDNEFLVNTTGETFTAESGYTYYGMMKANLENDPIVFGTFAPGTVAIPADKAYLKVSNGSAARLSVVFEESTGISTVETVKAQNGETYNLSGQRVAQPQKGLYIVNGKKVIIK